MRICVNFAGNDVETVILPENKGDKLAGTGDISGYPPNIGEKSSILSVISLILRKNEGDILGYIPHPKIYPPNCKLYPPNNGGNRDL